MDEDPDEVAARARIGDQVGSWTLERVLGIGGMASVFLGRRPDGAVAAVKVMHAYLAPRDDIRKRFLREGPIGSALAALGPLCEGLPQIYESGMAEDGTAFLVMEVLDGETVFDRLARDGVFPVEHVLWLAQSVLEVLGVAHTHGVIHRDLKPENLFIGQGGRVKVLDFGVARVLEDLPAGTGVLPEKTMTRTGTAIGSGAYMAPEQATGSVRDTDGRTDLFGLGATMYHLLAGRPVHGDLADARLVIAAATRQVAPIASVAPSLPADVAAVVDRAVVFKKAERYPDARTMRGDVIALRSGRIPPYVTAIAEGRVAPGAPLAG